jgi:hypothetical protein
MEVIQAIDLGATFAITTFQKDNPWLVPVFLVLAYAGSFWVLCPVAILAGGCFSASGRWRTGLLIVLALLTSTLLYLTVQPLVGRPRPEGEWVVPGRFQSDVLGVELPERRGGRLGSGHVGGAVFSLA